MSSLFGEYATDELAQLRAEVEALKRARDIALQESKSVRDYHELTMGILMEHAVAVGAPAGMATCWAVIGCLNGLRDARAEVELMRPVVAAAEACVDGTTFNPRTSLSQAVRAYRDAKRQPT